MSFVLPCRVYYEDTDAGGVVYYANYLKYLERCRTEWLRSVGVEQSMLLREHGLGFMVRRVEVDYRRPAILDDIIEVSLKVDKLGGASLIFLQVVTRGSARSAGAPAGMTPAVMTRPGAGAPDVLIEARVEIACVDMNTTKPQPIPGWIKDKLKALA